MRRGRRVPGDRASARSAGGTVGLPIGPLALVALVALLVGACGPGSGEPLAAAAGDWRLVGGTVPSGALVPLPTAEVTLVLGPDPAATDGGVLVGGSSGCNQYGTRFVPSPDGRVEVGEVAGTLMACADPAVTALEAGYLEGLALVTTVEVDGDRLVLSGTGADLRFARAPAAG